MSAGDDPAEEGSAPLLPLVCDPRGIGAVSTDGQAVSSDNLGAVLSLDGVDQVQTE